MKVLFKKKSKRAISEMVAYIILASIMLSLAVAVYSYINFAASSIKPPTDCKDGTEVRIESYSCDPTNGIINLTIKNNGKFEVDGIIARFSDNLSNSPATMLKPNYIGLTQPSSPTAGFFSFASLGPDSIIDAKFFNVKNDSTEYIAVDNSVKLVEIQPFIEGKDGKVVCIGTVIREKLTDTECRIKV